jgi:membrane protease YdiL (CAAX protease family)
MNDVLFYGAALAVAGYVFWIWLRDLRGSPGKTNVSELGARTSDGNPYASPAAIDEKGVAARSPSPTFPGAKPVGSLAVSVAVAGALVLLAVEVLGENSLGIAGQQTMMTVLFGLYTLAAAFVEELIFRGYLVYERGTRRQLVAGIFVVSAIFALLHPYLWHWKTPEGAASWEFWRGSLSPDFGTKALFSTSIVFVRSLWFYCVRFWPANPLRSLIPCIAAHLVTNAGVFALKASQGFVTGLY